MTWFGPPGRELYYEDSGRGEAVLLLPGWGGAIAELARLRAELSAGFRVVAADLPGSGRSRPQPRQYPATYYADDAALLTGLLDELGIEVAHLAGFSDGGEEALLIAARQPRRALSVVTWGAAGQIQAAPEVLDALATVVDDPPDAFTPLAAYLAEAYGPDGARMMTSSWAAAMRQIVAAGGDISRSVAGSITCPALLMTGSDDPFCPPRLVAAMAAAIPRGEFRELPGAGHDIYQSNYGWLARQLTDWLGAH